MRLKIASIADAPVVSEILTAAYSTLYRGWYADSMLEKALPAMSRARPELLASGTYYIAVENDTPIACGGWSRRDPLGSRIASHIGHIRHFATHPSFLARGAGSKIIDRCFDQAKTDGVREMDSLSSLTAEAFYARHGFVQIGPVSVPMGGEKFACMLMRRFL